MKKIWIVGSLGHMGQALIRLLDMMEYELYETDKDELDITDEHAVSLFMHRNRPDVVINCAGYHPSAGAAQSETDMAYKVNAVGARNLAQSAESIQAKLIQISTDDVFSSASDTPYNEFDDVNPVGLFAKSKYAGEKFVIQLMTRYVIIRSSWIYGIGKDFLNEYWKLPQIPKYPPWNYGPTAAPFPLLPLSLPGGEILHRQRPLRYLSRRMQRRFLHTPGICERDPASCRKRRSAYRHSKRRHPGEIFRTG